MLFYTGLGETGSRRSPGRVKQKNKSASRGSNSSPPIAYWHDGACSYSANAASKVPETFTTIAQLVGETKPNR